MVKSHLDTTHHVVNDPITHSPYHLLLYLHLPLAHTEITHIMAPRLRVLLSSPSAAHPPTAPCPVNSPTPTKVTTDGFDGEISVWVKGFEGDERAGDGSEYFGVRGAMTYAIVVRGERSRDE
jgi:hypothetical protein